MPNGATFDSFERELAHLVEIFGRNLPACKSAGYDEASLRQEFLNPFFRALGWEIENRAGLIPQRQALQNAVTATDQQIDALVYELYGLTESEIKMVETQ